VTKDLFGTEDRQSHRDERPAWGVWYTGGRWEATVVCRERERRLEGGTSSWQPTAHSWQIRAGYFNDRAQDAGERKLVGCGEM